jgi:hypothetical protein
MNIKSLLAGSAAVFVAVSGARAADAIIVEPEPVEYVRVCDMYGAGFFYIPGTEKCLRISGLFFNQYNVALDDHNSATDTSTDHNWRMFARLHFDARWEGEYGTVRVYARLLGYSGDTDRQDDPYSTATDNLSLATAFSQAYISYAGFRIGYTDDTYWETGGGNYGGGFLGAMNDGTYGGGDAMFLDYTWAANGWTATVGVQDHALSGEAGAPDMYFGFSYDQSGYGIYGIGMVTDNTPSLDNEFAWQFGGYWDLTDTVSVSAYYIDGNNTNYTPTHNDHGWGVSTKIGLTDSLYFAAGYEEMAIAEGNATLGLHWTVAPSLSLRGEYVWNETGSDGVQLRVQAAF